MAKPPPPKLNVGAVTTAGSGFHQRPLPRTNPDPDVDPAAAALIAGAPVHTVEPPKAEPVAGAVEPDVVVPTKPTPRRREPAPTSSTERFAPKFSLGGDVVETLDSMVRRARRKTGDDVTQSRVVSAALMALSEMSDADLVAAIGRVAVRPRGRKPAAGK